MRRSILSRRKRSRVKRGFELQLTSMMDILVIIVVFLLKSYSTNAVNFAASSKIKIPTSLAEEIPTEAPVVVIDPDSISFENEKVLNFTTMPQEGILNSGYTFAENHLADGGHRILPLYDSLVRSREKTELLMGKAIWKNTQGQVTKPHFQGVLIIQADKNVQYDLLRKVMYTAGAAGFKVFKLVTLRKET